MRRTGVIVWLVAFLSGCAGLRAPHVAPIAWLAPDRPTLPIVQPEELRCLTDTAAIKVQTRDRILRQYADELRAMIEWTP